ncbi:MAG: ornithine cyclodeaminase family protein [Gemmataceae bacterium]|nr:ornithine cyclodeaminase family protein [Gemmataceae bacterium]MCS7269923.1 ornithine cyclodeaminase family protein [Gemmataceae bacterium]MDW8244195.1 ornithine cyclodeaminase family protein [Thermogemmata sp.]
MQPVSSATPALSATPLYLSEGEVERLVSMELALDAVATAFRKLGLEEAENVPRQRCQTDHVMLHVLPAAAKTLGVIGFKAYTSSKQGTRFHVTLYDGKSGALTAWLEADVLGQFRTGAATGVATRKLARPEARTVGCLGAGKQARTQILAVCKVRSIQQVRVFCRTPERRQAFAERLRAETGVEVLAVDSAQAAVRGQDIIITATTAREPILLGEWLSPGQHVNLIGSNMISKAEADVEVFRRASLVVVDSKEQAKLEAGDFVNPLHQGVLHWSDIIELAPLLVGRYPGRQSPDDITVFKSLGLGIEDIALAARLVELARQHGLGRPLLPLT